MSIYVLVHGGFHGGWCWDKVVPLIEKSGHHVVAPDLPGHGADKTATTDVTLQLYVDHICTVLNEQTEPVILVGHSMAGAVITQVAEYLPEKISKLVYLTAFILGNGQCMNDWRTEDIPVEHALVLSKDERSMTVVKEAIQGIFYSDCSAEDIAWAKSLLDPQATEPFGATVKTSAGKYGSVAKIYIECLEDRAMVPELQKRIYTMHPCEKVVSINTGHSSFISAPKVLASQLLSLK